MVGKFIYSKKNLVFSKKAYSLAYHKYFTDYANK